MIRLRTVALCVLVVCLTTSCGGDSGPDFTPAPPDEPTEPEPPSLREGATEFAVDVPGDLEPPGTLGGVCVWTFDVAVIPDDATSVQLVTCTVEFATDAEDANRGNASLRAPDGESEALELRAGKYHAEVLLGPAVVNGSWRARLVTSLSCGDYSGATLSLHGDYFTED